MDIGQGIMWVGVCYLVAVVFTHVFTYLAYNKRSIDDRIAKIEQVIRNYSLDC